MPSNKRKERLDETIEDDDMVDETPNQPQNNAPIQMLEDNDGIDEAAIAREIASITPLNTATGRVDPNVGTIKKMILKNFMTYSDVTFEPTTGLNLIIGANGTGKSSISAAICIGLNGPINLTGRAKDAGSYIKYGTNVCTIEITLEGPSKRRYKVFREMKKKSNTNSCVTKWMINGATCKGEDVKKMTKGFGINLDNLCQYLPQERVKEFAQQKPFDLLVNTQKALDYTLYEQHEALITFGKEKREKENQLKQLQLEIQSAKERNAEISKDYQLAKEFSTIKKKESKYTRGKKQFEYETAQLDHEAKEKEFTKQKRYETEAKGKLEVLKLAFKNASSTRDDTTAIRNFQKLNADIETKIRNNYDEIESEENTLKAKIKLYNKKKDQENRREELVIQVQHEIDQYEVEFKSLTEQIYASLGELTEDEQKYLEASIKNSGEEARQNHALLTQIIVERRTKVFEQKERVIAQDKKQQETAKGTCLKNFKQLKKDMDTKELEIKNLENSKNRVLNNIKGERKFKSAIEFKKIVDRKLEDGYFRGKVIGPLIAYIEPTSDQFANMIEPIIGMNDLESFAFQYDDDRLKAYETLTNKGRDHKVNMFTVENRSSAKSSQQVLDDGFDGTLADQCSLDPLLVHHYSLGRFPYKKCTGNRIPEEYTNDWLDRNGYSQSYYLCPRNITIKQTVTKARFYAGTVSESTNVRKARFLTPGNSANVQQQIISLRNEYQELLRDSENEKINNQDIDIRINDLIKKHNSVKQQKGEMARLISRIKQHEDKRMKLRSNLTQYNTKIDLEEMKNMTKEQAIKFSRIVLKNQKSVSKLLVDRECLAVKETQRLIETGMKSAKTDRFENEVRTQQDVYDEQKELTRIAATERDAIAADIRRLRHELFDMMGMKKSVSNAAEILHDKIKAEIQYLREQGLRNEEDLEHALNGLSEQLRKSSTIDNTVIDDYQKREKAIDAKQKEAVRAQANIHTLIQSNSKNKEDWKGAMTSHMETTNRQFMQYFTDMGCQGRVEFGPMPIEPSMAEFGDPNTEKHDEDDYSKYGVIIWVNFRKESKLKMLTGSTQSGGEKSVSTMLFLLAMQPISKSPFRLIDEINQGMDNRNERMVFNALVTTAETSKTQYFLITPKLLTDLSYSSRMAVCCVHNGECFGRADNANDRVQNNVRVDVTSSLKGYRKRATAAPQAVEVN